MACRYYDDILVAKILKWIPEASNLRVLGPSESKKLFELTADDGKDQPFKLPIISLSRNRDIELLSTVKQPKSYDGLRLIPNNIKTDLSDLKGDAYQKARVAIPDGIYTFNVIPIKLLYDLTIYTKTEEEVDEYVRNFLFKLINNPVIKVRIPYNDTQLEHIANIRVLSNISDTSDISERIFSGQFHCWTIQLEIQDAFLFSLPYRRNWQLYISEDAVTDENLTEEGWAYLELSKILSEEGEIEPLGFNWKKEEKNK